MDDNEWGDLDESAMEECMVLATQMCSQLAQNQDKSKKDNGTMDHKLSRPLELEGKKHSNANFGSFHNGFTNEYDSSGFSSMRSNSVNTSRLMPNKPKNTRASFSVPSASASKNSYSSRFNDFSIPSSSGVKTTSLTGKPSHSSGKVYNSIPMKGIGGTVSSTKGLVQPSLENRHENENQHDLVKRLQEQKARVEEEVLLKQGEVRNTV